LYVRHDAQVLAAPELSFSTSAADRVAVEMYLLATAGMMEEWASLPWIESEKGPNSMQDQEGEIFLQAFHMVPAVAGEDQHVVGAGKVGDRGAEAVVSTEVVIAAGPVCLVAIARFDTDHSVNHLR
jgi:hypothetical protein